MSHHDEACMTIVIRSKKRGNQSVISIGACGKKQGDEIDAIVEDASDSELPAGTKLENIDTAIYVSNPCIYIRINGRLKKVCW